jgi:hypothetical protein
MAVVTPDLPEIFEEAFERAGLEMRSGYDLKTARRSLNILTLEWQNRGINLFTIESGTLSLSAGTATYTMPSDTIDLIEHTIRTGSGTSQLDTNVTRISVSTYVRLKGIDSISSGIAGTTTNFVPPRFVPCLVSGLAYYIAMKRPEVAGRVQALKQEYEFQFELAAGEDAETASIKFVPHNTFFVG